MLASHLYWALWALIQVSFGIFGNSQVKREYVVWSISVVCNRQKCPLLILIIWVTSSCGTTSTRSVRTRVYRWPNRISQNLRLVEYIMHHITFSFEIILLFNGGIHPHCVVLGWIMVVALWCCTILLEEKSARLAIIAYYQWFVFSFSPLEKELLN